MLEVLELLAKLLLPEPADGEEALRKTRCDCLFWCQTQQEQVIFTSVPVPPQLTPFPHHTKMGEPSLAQPPHKSSSAPQDSTVITVTTSPSVTVNFKVQLQWADYHDLCHVESQKRHISLHSGNAIHLCYQLLPMQKIWKSSTFSQNETAPVSLWRDPTAFVLPVTWTWRGY